MKDMSSMLTEMKKNMGESFEKMVTIGVHYRLKPGMREKLLEFVGDNVENTRKEKGNIFYAHYPSLENDQDMFVFEIWETVDHVNAHNSAPHYLEFANKRKPMLEFYLSTRYSSSIISQRDSISTWSDK